MMEVMSALLGVIERETALVRAGKLREAMALEPQKTGLSRRYVNAVGQLKAARNTCRRPHPSFWPRCIVITTRFAPCCRSI